ncbi:hypothetical protein ACGLYK_002728 [Escherichia coli]|nr:hypothetical protein [Escherichia coli]
MTTRITFNMTSDETLRIVDEYCHTHKLSRSKVIDALLSATAPVLNDINCYYQLAGKLQSRLLNGVYQRDLPHKRNVVSAEKYCLELWENKLFTKRILEFDYSNGVLYALKHKRHYRRDKMIGRVESRRIKDICEYQMQLSGEKAKYACFIYIERTIYNHDNPSGGTPVKAAVGNAVILLAKDVIYDEYFFDLRQSFFVSVKDLMASGAKGIPETQKYPDVYCWIPLFSINSGVVITPVYKIDPRKPVTVKKPDQITVVCNYRE